jgi:hypothetical protein
VEDYIDFPISCGAALFYQAMVRVKESAAQFV